MKQVLFRFLPLLIVLVLLYACQRKRKVYFDGFSRNEAGLYYKMLKIGDGDYKVNAWDDITFACTFKKNNDSIFFSSSNEKVYLNPEDSTDKSLFIAHFVGLVQGDSVAYYVNTKTLFESYFQTKVPDYCKNDSLIKVEVMIKHLVKEISISETELKQIRTYVDKKGFTDAEELPNKIVILERKKSDSPEFVSKGKTVVLSYKGRFLNDSLFDIPFYPMQFVYGTPDQILKGLNFVIKGMNKGEYAKIILPSYLAYGENGNSNATVPPFTPVLYEITITDIK